MAMAEPQSIDFDDDSLLLRESQTGYSKDGVLVGVSLSFTDGSDVRFVSHYEELSGLVASLASSQECALQTRVAKELGQEAKLSPPPAGWLLPSRIATQRSPEGHLFLAFWGEDATMGPLVVRLSPERVRELHGMFAQALGRASTGNPWQPAKPGR